MNARIVGRVTIRATLSLRMSGLEGPAQPGNRLNRWCSGGRVDRLSGQATWPRLQPTAGINHRLHRAHRVQGLPLRAFRATVAEHLSHKARFSLVAKPSARWGHRAYSLLAACHAKGVNPHAAVWASFSAELLRTTISPNLAVSRRLSRSTIHSLQSTSVSAEPHQALSTRGPGN